MKNLTLFAVLICFLTFSEKSLSQSWLPQPVKSPFLDAVIGTWTSTPYEFMGNTSSDVVTYKPILNGQYLEVDVKRTDNEGFVYEGKEIIKPSPGGSMSGYYCDIFGNDRSSSYSGIIEGNKIILTSESLYGTGSREIIIDGNTMIQNVTFQIPDKAGNETTEQKITITYRREI